jgi:hypothetical protein
MGQRPGLLGEWQDSLLLGSQFLLLSVVNKPMLQITVIVQFLIYLRAELNSHWPVRVNTNTNNSSMTVQDKTNNKQWRKNKNREKWIGLGF